MGRVLPPPVCASDACPCADRAETELNAPPERAPQFWDAGGALLFTTGERTMERQTIALDNQRPSIGPLQFCHNTAAVHGFPAVRTERERTERARRHHSSSSRARCWGDAECSGRWPGAGLADSFPLSSVERYAEFVELVRIEMSVRVCVCVRPDKCWRAHRFKSPGRIR